MNNYLKVFLLGVTVLFSISFADMKINTNFWNMGWGSGSADPFKDGYKNVSGDNPWKPEFLEETAIYGGFRFMDFGETNNAEQHHTPNWADRTQKSSSNQNPMAYERMIDLCNVVHVDMWVCIPHVANDDYVQNLAELIYNQLDPELKIYVEFSNETWNGMFHQTQWCMDQAGSVPGLSEGNQWYDGQRFHAYRSIQCFAIFESVFTGADRRRLVTVMGSTGIHAFTETHLEIMNTPAFNPTGLRFDAVALAPYVGNGLDGNSGSIIQELTSGIGDVIQSISHSVDAVRAENISLIAYEGGQHILKAADVASRLPGMYDFYIAYLDAMAPIFDEFWLYAHSAAYGSGGAWGAKEYIGQPISEAHRYRAIVDWVNEHPTSIRTPYSISPLTRQNSFVPSTSMLFDLHGRLIRTVPTGKTLSGSTCLVVMRDGTGSPFKGVFMGNR